MIGATFFIVFFSLNLYFELKVPPPPRLVQENEVWDKFKQLSYRGETEIFAEQGLLLFKLNYVCCCKRLLFYRNIVFRVRVLAPSSKEDSAIK
jgi:hypothetical protein